VCTVSVHAPKASLFGLGGENLSSAANLGQWFDVIVHVQASTPSQHL
jgi:hypothetical protein